MTPRSNRALQSGFKPRAERVSAPMRQPPTVRPVVRVADPQPVTQAQGFGSAFFLFCLYTFILIGRPQDYLPALLPLRPALVMTALTVLVTMLTAGARSRRTSLFHEGEARLYLLFFFAMCISIPFSVHRRISFEAVILSYVVNVAFFALFILHVDRMDKMRRIALVIVVSSFIFTVLALRNGTFFAGRYRIGGGMYDANDIAFVEISLMAFSTWVLVGAFGWGAKAAALASILLGSLLTLYTASRGGLLGLSTFFFFFIALGVPRVKASVKLAMCIALVGVAFMNADKINIERFSTLGSIENDYNFEEFGRAEIWGRGVRMFTDNPLTGVGVQGFPIAIGAARLKDNRRPVWQAAHSAYLQVLAETGIVGISSFALLVFTCLITFGRIRRRSKTFADPNVGLLSGLLLMGFMAQLVSAVFLSQAYSMFFTLMFAVSAALKRIAADAAPAAGTIPPARTGLR